MAPPVKWSCRSSRPSPRASSGRRCRTRAGTRRAEGSDDAAAALGTTRPRRRDVAAPDGHRRARPVAPQRDARAAGQARVCRAEAGRRPHEERVALPQDAGWSRCCRRRSPDLARHAAMAWRSAVKPWIRDALVEELRRIAGRLSNARHEAGRIVGMAAISNPDAIRAVELGTLQAEADGAA